MKPVRCAIYTRKSSEEGLEQDFNSLDAQREACAAYILSQASEGWTALPDIYDDGGISGGTLERPALKRLLTDVEAGRIDIIVVYKVDRLSRSLFDFAKLVEAFEKSSTSFVSVTQSFNTTTSMGRLTLNMLLSFAQFEREVTAERIRDKIAASKAKGMWMGGTPPIGYRPEGRSLQVVEEHAKLVRHLFDRYLALGNVRLLMDELHRDKLVAPPRELGTGKKIGSAPFARGNLYLILRNPIYVGRIPHGDKTYPGLHQGIVAQDVWDRAQAMLTAHCQGGKRTRMPKVSPLAGKVFDAAGDPLVATHATKGKVRYRYYVSRALQTGAGQQGTRIPAREIEAAVAQRIASELDDVLSLLITTGLPLPARDTDELQSRSSELAARLRRGKTPELQQLCSMVRVFDYRIEIDVEPAAIAELLGITVDTAELETLCLTSSVRLTRSGRVMRLVRNNGAALAPEQSEVLIRLVNQGLAWWAELRGGEIRINAIAAREGKTDAYVGRIVRLAFLAPAVVDAIVAGRLRVGVASRDLTAPDAVDPAWDVQGTRFLPAPSTSQ